MSASTIIVFGAHPDDIEIGMGGSIKKLTAAGKHVIACVGSIPNNKQLRGKEVQAAAKILGVSDVVYLYTSPHHLNFDRKTIGKIDALLEKHRPVSLFTHSAVDSHQDHLNLTNCVLAAGRHNHFNIYMYEQAIPGGITHGMFRPQLYIDITTSIEDKIQSIQAHKSQVDKYGQGWINGVRGRAMHRGYQIKTDFAEAFEVVKIKESTGLL
jgi:N-acetylglucosamine malate deacetylase 1